MQVDEERVYKARVAGKSVRKIARELGCMEADVNAVLQERSKELLTDGALRVALMLENQRLDDVLEALYPKATAGDPVAAGLMVKLSQRRSCLLGLDAPIGHAITVMSAPPKAESSTESIRRVLDTVLKISPRERELLDKHELDGDNSPEILAEINQLRAARGKPPLPQPDDPSAH